MAPVDCLTDAGGVVGRRPLAAHAPSKALTDRLEESCISRTRRPLPLPGTNSPSVDEQLRLNGLLKAPRPRSAPSRCPTPIWSLAAS